MKTKTNNLKFQVIYKDRFYEFDDGLNVYLFHLGILFEVDKTYGIRALLKYCDKTAECVSNDCNEPDIEDFAQFVAEQWDIVCDMDCYELLDDYYEQKDDEN